MSYTWVWLQTQDQRINQVGRNLRKSLGTWWRANQYSITATRPPVASYSCCVKIFPRMSLWRTSRVTTHNWSAMFGKPHKKYLNAPVSYSRKPRTEKYKLQPLARSFKEGIQWTQEKQAQGTAAGSWMHGFKKMFSLSKACETMFSTRQRQTISPFNGKLVTGQPYLKDMALCPLQHSW